VAPDRASRISRRRELVALIIELAPDVAAELGDETPLISSGLVESVALLNLALWVEEQIDSTVELGAFDLAAEWDTPSAILDFVERHREAPSGARQRDTR